MKKEILEFRKKVQNYLLKNVDKWEFKEVTQYTANYLFDSGEIFVWISNGEDSIHLYCDHYDYLGIDVDFELTDKQQKILWDKTQEDKKRCGEKREIKMTQMRNDLFFKFEGIFDEVRFTGYDDNDWWTKYKPKIVKEDEIEWEIDYENMLAIYKPKK